MTRIYSPEDGAAPGPAGHDQRHARALRLRPARPRRRRQAEAASAALGDAATGARSRALITALENGDVRARRCATQLAKRSGKRSARRCSASPARAARARSRSPTSWCGACGSTRTTACTIAVHLHRPVAQAHRRRAAGRPHPHERDRPLAPARLHALARDARHAASEISAALPDVIAAVQARPAST